MTNSFTPCAMLFQYSVGREGGTEGGNVFSKTIAELASFQHPSNGCMALSSLRSPTTHCWVQRSVSGESRPYLQREVNHARHPSTWSLQNTCNQNSTVKNLQGSSEPTSLMSITFFKVTASSREICCLVAQEIKHCLGRTWSCYVSADKRFISQEAKVGRHRSWHCLENISKFGT